MNESERFRCSLLRMIQAGTFEEIIGCQHGRCATVEFRLQHVYRVEFARQSIILREQEIETIRRYADGCWRRMRPTVLDRGRIVLERDSGRILESPSLGAGARVAR